MFCEIILSRRFPKHLGIFDYRIPENLVTQLKIGQLVTLPFRKSEVEGVVVKIKKTSSFENKLKELIKINNPKPIITAPQIALAEWIAEYYFISLGTVIKMILPPVPQKKSERGQAISHSNRPPPELSSESRDLANLILKSRHHKMLYWPSSADQKAALLHLLIKKIKKQILIIVPEIRDISKIYNLIPADQLKNVSILHSQLNKNQFYRHWQSIISYSSKIIIGTKLALFAPLRKPELIIIDQAENQNHKQADQNPRYHGNLVAEKLATLNKSKLLYISQAPPVPLYQKIQDNEIKLIKNAERRNKALHIINMAEEHKKRNYSLFSDYLLEQASKKLEKKQAIFLFINKRGSASAVICKDCSNIIKCKKCQRPLTYHDNSKTLFCHRCNAKSELPPFCPQCSGANFRFSGPGTQKVEAEAKKTWPQANIVRLDKDTDIKKYSPATNIIIGTEFAFDYLDWDKIKLTGIISADTFLHLPDYTSTERTYQLLSKIRFLAKQPIIIQTYSPDNPAIKSIKTQKLSKFYDLELAERKNMNYPPFTGLIKLIYQNKDKIKCWQETKKLYRILKTSPLDISLLTPVNTLVHGKWQMYLVIKYKNPELSLINKIIRQVPNNWIIDRDPISLL